MKNYKDINDYEIIYMISENDEDASRMLYEKYRPIIVKMAEGKAQLAKKYGLELEDLIQEGYFGLYSAIKNYDEAKNILFYTYAIHCINSKIINLIKTSSCYRHMALNSSMSLDLEDEDGKKTMQDTITDKDLLLPEDECIIRQLSSLLRFKLYELEINDACVFELYINGFKSIEIANLLNITTIRVRNVLTRIKKKLKVEKICI